MIYKLSSGYLGRLESQKNWAVFAGYVIAAAIAVVLAQQFELRVALLGLAGLVAAGIHHWYRSHIHQQIRTEGEGVEIEVVERSLVWRTDAGTYTFPIDSLKSVIYQPSYETIELRLSSGEGFLLRGVNDAEKLAGELQKSRALLGMLPSEACQPAEQLERSRSSEWNPLSRPSLPLPDHCFSIRWLQSSTGARFLIAVLTADTDMVLRGWETLSSVQFPEIVVTSLTADEDRILCNGRWEDYAVCVEARLEKQLGRNDLRVIQAERRSDSEVKAGAARIAYRDVLAHDACTATEVQQVSLVEFLKGGGRILWAEAGQREVTHIHDETNWANHANHGKSP